MKQPLSLSKLFTAALIFCLTHHAQALTTLLSDSFTSTTSLSTFWIYGTGSISSALATNDTFAINTTSGTLTVVDSAPYAASPVTIHTQPSGNFKATTDKVLQLNAELTITNSTLTYGIGLFDTTVSARQANSNAIILKISPGLASNNVQLYATNADGVITSSVNNTVVPTQLSGAHAYALQVDYLTSTLAPTVRAYSNGILLATLNVAQTGGIRPQLTGTTQATSIRAAIFGYSTASSGASFSLDNVTLCSYTPGSGLLTQINSSRRVNTQIFGHNLLGYRATQPRTNGYGIWNGSTYSATVVNKLKTDLVSVKSLRYPGGGEANLFNFKETIGPVASRAYSNWDFGLDEYMKVCQSFGASPMYTTPQPLVNGSGLLPMAQMPGHLADLVEYLNAPATPAHPMAQARATNSQAAPYGVTYFELGNECYYHLTADEYIQFVETSAWAMRAIAPSIQLGLVIKDFGPAIYNDWNLPILQQVGYISDFAILHIYSPYSGDGDTVYTDPIKVANSCMAVGEQIDYQLQDAHAFFTEQIGHDLPVAITEYNSLFVNDDAGVPPYRFSYASALECADMLRIYLKPSNGVIAAHYWLLLNEYFGALRFTTPASASTSFTEMPAYPLFKMWGQHFGTTLLDVSLNSPTANYSANRGTFPAQGTTYQPEQYISTTTLSSVYDTARIRSEGGSAVTASVSADTLTLNLNNYSTSGAWPRLAFVNFPDSTTRYNFRLSYEARYTSTSSALPSGLFITAGGDGDNITNLTMDSLLKTEWTSYLGEYISETPTSRAYVLANLLSSTTTSGTLQIRNAVLETYKQAVYPSYALITSAASVSADGNTSYVIVINKANYAIPVNLSFNGFSASSAKYWQVNGPSLATTTNSVLQTVNGATLTLNSSTATTCTFPAHSMTAIELYK